LQFPWQRTKASHGSSEGVALDLGNVFVTDHSQLACVTFNVSGLRPLLALELMRIAARG
jgi:hypothetical protein